MRRRDVVYGLAACAASQVRSDVACSQIGSVTAFAQQRPKLVPVLMQGGAYRVGFDGLKQALETEAPAKSIRLVLREGGGDIDLLTAAAKEFEEAGADLLVTFATTVSLAAKAATEKVPIVFVAGSDPVKYGLVQSISNPGDRLTGVASFGTEITPKRFALLKEIVPSLRRVLTFHNPESTSSVAGSLENARAAAQALGIQLDIRDVRSAADAVKALDAMKPGEADAFFFPSDAILLTHSQAIIERATSLGMATMAQNLGLVADGALAGYGLDYREEGRVAARYVLLILGGAHPSALPVAVREQHALGINLKTAQVLGLTIPPTLLARADEVIE